MPRALLIDTSQDTALLALAEGSQLLSVKQLPGARLLSSALFPELEKLCPVKDLAYIAVGVGPGSYMGIRTGATIAKTLSYALEIPLIEIPSPLLFLPPDLEGPFTFIGDAKMGQLYMIQGEMSEIPQLSPIQLIAPNEIPSGVVIQPPYQLNPQLFAEIAYRKYLKEEFSPTLNLVYIR